MEMGFDRFFEKRSRLEIAFRILKMATKDKLKKTHIMYQCNLSYSSTVKYLKMLMEFGLIETNKSNDEGIHYRITPKGLAVLRHFQELSELLEA